MTRVGAGGSGSNSDGGGGPPGAGGSGSNSDGGGGPPGDGADRKNDGAGSVVDTSTFYSCPLCMASGRVPLSLLDLSDPTKLPSLEAGYQERLDKLKADDFATASRGYSNLEMSLIGALERIATGRSGRGPITDADVMRLFAFEAIETAGWPTLRDIARAKRDSEIDAAKEFGRRSSSSVTGLPVQRRDRNNKMN